MRKTTGLSLLLLIFISLCLIIFSLLSLSGAVADKTLSQKSAERTQEYYAAVSSANQLLAEIDSLLSEELIHTETSELTDSDSIADTYLKNCMAALQTNFPDFKIRMENKLILTFSVPFSDGQILYISLMIDYPAAQKDPLYQITEWKVINTDTWTPDLSQKLYIP